MKSKKIKFFQPVKLSFYPNRTKSELRLIDKRPWRDTDKDRVPNIFDCKPLNRNRQGWTKAGWRATLNEKKSTYKKLREAGIPLGVAYRVRSWRPTRVKDVIAGERMTWEIKQEKERIKKTGLKTPPSELEYKRQWREKPEVMAFHQSPEWKEYQQQYKKARQRGKTVKAPSIKEWKEETNKEEYWNEQDTPERKKFIEKDMKHLNELYDVPAIEKKIKEKTGKKATYDEIIDEIYPSANSRVETKDDDAEYEEQLKKLKDLGVIEVEEEEPKERLIKELEEEEDLE
jgi:hypothetical protein